MGSSLNLGLFLCPQVVRHDRDRDPTHIVDYKWQPQNDDQSPTCRLLTQRRSERLGEVQLCSSPARAWCIAFVDEVPSTTYVKALIRLSAAARA